MRVSLTYRAWAGFEANQLVEPALWGKSGLDVRKLAYLLIHSESKAHIGRQPFDVEKMRKGSTALSD